jgi:Domain of unknown function (DUF397)
MDGWRKSTYSDGNGGQCVELASSSGAILVRDTTNRDGGTLAFTPDAWTSLTVRLSSLVDCGRVRSRAICR